MNNIPIFEVGNVVQNYLVNKHPSESNGFIIRISDNISKSHVRRRSYFVNFPFKLLDNEMINEIENIISNLNYENKMTIVSIDPINVNKKFEEIIIRFGGSTINPEELVKNLSIDIIEQMNNHLIEKYFDDNYEEIDITDSENRERIDEILDNVNIHDIYKYAEIYVPIKVSFPENNIDETVLLFLNGTIKTKSQIVDIIDEIRLVIDSDDINESFTYDKNEIVYKFAVNETEKEFTLITDVDPDISK